uniref:Pentatricopeptide repeat-containing protein n=1 Tax=Cucumis sativus TaxID=3659 RepID=A0A0A0LYJ9_CUCSA
MAAKCQPSTDIYTMLINVYGKVSLNSCAGFPFGATEIFSLMQYMGCYPDRASYNIMVDAYGRAGLHEGDQDKLKKWAEAFDCEVGSLPSSYLGLLWVLT